MCMCVHLCMNVQCFSGPYLECLPLTNRRKYLCMGTIASGYVECCGLLYFLALNGIRKTKTMLNGDTLLLAAFIVPFNSYNITL